MACKPSSGAISCSVCLEHVSDGAERSIAKLKCGHHFHLDCIGSAFNAKGSMQCPNCRHVEDGQWLYASGCRPQVDEFPPFEDTPISFDDDEYEVYTSIAEVHPHSQVSWQWCPYPQFSVTFEELERPTPGLPDGDVIFHYLGDPTAPASGLRAPRCPILEHARRVEEQLQQHVQQFEEQLVVVQNQIEPPQPGNGGGNGNGNGGGLPGGNIRGPQQPFPVERTGWLSQHLPASTSAVGMMNDVGLSSLPIERFRWSAQANRSEATQPRFTGPLENSPTSSWPCPQHAVAAGVGSGNAGTQNTSGSARRSRHRGAHHSSSSSGSGSNRVNEVPRGSRHRELGHHHGGGFAAAAAASGNIWQNHHQQQQQQHQQQMAGGFEGLPDYTAHYSWLLDSPPPSAAPSGYPPFGHSYEPHEYFYGRQQGFNPFASRGYYQQQPR